MATVLFILWLALALVLLPSVASPARRRVIRVPVEHGRSARSEELVRLLRRGRGR